MLYIDPKTIPFRNARYVNEAKTRINVDLEIGPNRWQAFTLDENDGDAKFNLTVLRNRISKGPAIAAHEPPDATPTNGDVNFERDRRLTLGQPLSITGYAYPIYVNWADQANLTSVAVAAAAQIQQGNGEQTIVWRDNQNVEHILTYSQVLELHVVATAATSAIYQFSWALKQGTIPGNYADDIYWQN